MDNVHVSNHGNITHPSSLVVVVSFADTWVCFLLPPTFYYHKLASVFGVNMTWSDSPIKTLSVSSLAETLNETLLVLNLWLIIQVSFLLSRSIHLRRVLFVRDECGDPLQLVRRRKKKNKRKMPLLAYSSWRAIRLSLVFQMRIFTMQSRRLYY